MPRIETVLIEPNKAEDGLAQDFHRVIEERFPGGDVNVSAVCVAASGLVAAYIAALPDPAARTLLLDRLIAGLREEVELAPLDGLH